MESKSDMSTIDWSVVRIPEIRDARVLSGKLSQLDYAKLLIGSKLMNRSLAGNAQSALTVYVRKNWVEHEKLLIVEANQHGLTPEQYIEKLLGDES
jgi:hypothetical protein